MKFESFENRVDAPKRIHSVLGLGALKALGVSFMETD